MRYVLVVGIAVFCNMAVRAGAQQATGDDASGLAGRAQLQKADQTELIVHPARNVQPQQISEALKKVFAEDPRIKTVEVSPGGVLFVRGSQGVREELLGFLEVFDCAPDLVEVQILLLKATETPEGPPQISSLCGTIESVMGVIKQGEASKRLVVFDRVEATVLGHQRTNALLYHSTPITAVHRTGKVLDTVTYPESGMTVNITTRVDEDSKIFVELGFKSIEFTGEVLIGPPFEAGPVLANRDIQKTLQLDDGHAQAVSVAFDDNSSRPAILVVAARIRNERE